MNRSALCIKMLHILYGRNKPISKNELAELLETNPRNIHEFKKELEIAGYMIESVSGMHGGYLLKDDSVFPSLSLSDKEKEAINETLTYLKAQKNFIHYADFETAMNKLKAKTNHSQNYRETIYLSDIKKSFSHSENLMTSMINEAIKERKVLHFLYRSSYHHATAKREVLPYELIVTDEGFYLLADDKSIGKTHQFKYFKIIDERMQNMHITERNFIRDVNFKVNDHIGSTTVMKDLYEVEIEIYGINAQLVNERKIENLISKRFENDILYLKFMMEGNLRLKNFILSLGSECKVISPSNIQNEIQKELLKAISHYQ